MYGMKEFNGGDGEFYSHVTKRVYRYKHSQDGSLKREAKALMEAEVQEVREKIAKKLGRQPTDKELRQGESDPPQDTRDLRTRLAENMTHVSSGSAPDPDRNPYTGRIAEVEAMPTRTREQRAQRKRRLEMLKASVKQFDERLQSEKEAKRLADERSTYVLDAKLNYDSARLCPGFTPEDVAITKRLYDDVKSGAISIEEYKHRCNQWEKLVKSRRDMAAKLKLQEAEEARLSLRRFGRGRLSLKRRLNRRLRPARPLRRRERR